MKTIRLLTIGNSFADNALTYLEPIAESNGKVRFTVGRANLGGCSLEKHWNLATYTARHPEYKTYPLRRNGAGETMWTNLQEALVTEKWDFVTLQQVSWQSWRTDTFEPSLGKLVKLVGDLAPLAGILLHQTWAYQADAPFFPENGLTQERMYDSIRDAYRRYAAKYNCRILPSGDAVQRARNAEGHTYLWPEKGYDYKYAVPPTLPRQENSLAVGWYWAIRETAEGVPELRLDANHLNHRGNYLAGCVWHETMTGQTCSKLTYVPRELEAADAAFLRRIAHETVA